MEVRRMILRPPISGSIFRVVRPLMESCWKPVEKIRLPVFLRNVLTTVFGLLKAVLQEAPIDLLAVIGRMSIHISVMEVLPMYGEIHGPASISMMRDLVRSWLHKKPRVEDLIPGPLLTICV